jgi:mannose-6-phosphate isomerase-like protein (cupin superfamily)
MSSPGKNLNPTTIFPDRDGFVASKDDAPAYWFYGTLWIILADVHQTGGSFSVIEQWMRKGVGPPLHVHNVDEWFFVLSGAMDLQLGERHVTATAGDSIWIPRGTDHAFTTTEETHVLNGYAPGGVEQIIAGIGKPAERRELPPEDLELPNSDAFGRLLDNYWSSLSSNSWARTAPQR